MFSWLTKKIRNLPEADEVFQRIKRKEKVMAQGISGSRKSFLIAGLWQEFTRSMLVLTYAPSEAEKLITDLRGILGAAAAEEIAHFPAYDLLAHEEAYEKETAGARLSVLGRLARGERLLVVACWPALQRKIIPPGVLQEFTIQLAPGAEVDRESFLQKLVEMGYERTEKVDRPGQFSVRGSILDLYPPDREDPLRIEFFGDEIESIRSFDPETQRSSSLLPAVAVLPAREGLWSKQEMEAAAGELPKLIREQAGRFRNRGDEKTAFLLEETFQAALEKLTGGQVFPGIERFLPLIRRDLVPFWSYLPEALVVIDEPVRGTEYLRVLEEEQSRTISSFLEQGLLLPAETCLYIPAGELQGAIARIALLQISVVARALKGTGDYYGTTLPLRPAPEFAGQGLRLPVELANRQKNGWVVGLALSGSARREHMAKALMEEEGLEAFKIITEPEKGAGDYLPGYIYLLPQGLTAGLELPIEKILILTETEIFGSLRPQRKSKPRYAKEGVRLTDFAELAPGDYVVHINHGIGIYRGLKKEMVQGALRDYLEVEYAAGDRLFVPTDQFHLLQKYVGSPEAPPRINRLGGGEWQRVKNRVKESLREMADSLLQLYAARLSTRGHSFSPDTPWQQEFEEAFIYEETPDQIRAGEEIKKDMESLRPMDRLLCGDVGYGKTEVAMRAAFKAIMDGKQVAVLAPTTILAQQHFQTFTQRFSGYPVKIAALSRFQSPSEQARIVRDLRTGIIDLVIGTHRLLSRDIEFKDLGLLIIDEEQKFGVAHKERLKELKKNVDALALTATPIPRTLYMSMVGIRDISMIETPPEDRHPVRTYVMEFNEKVIAEAIRREIARKGQVFFVYNRVETIDRMAVYLQDLVPEARIAIAHGQMPEDTLEEVMLSFYEGSADVLVCTTIIENGLDIPNVNTLIVYDADRLGLAQLYQLRGRVGRSTRVAYAYFTYRKDKVLAETAEKRLAAIRDFTDLGSGFKIALRDLEIRGAGNLLGPEQHGHIAAVGFELYCRLLEEAMKERQ
ncbi:MAG: transcription-repair coupling factor, partial [Clostridia bacterium]|nr:transcription-repair coupling factor [Clostridia bacterium]